MTYVEFPFDRIVTLHVKTDRPPDGGGGPGGGPCGSGWLIGPNAFGDNVRLWLGDIRGKDGPAGITAGGLGVAWNPTSCCPATPIGFNPADGTFDTNYFVPGGNATRLKITLKWADLIGGANDYSIGFWIYRNRSPIYPYRLLNNPAAPPPANLPPNGPDVSQYMNGGGAGEFIGFDVSDWLNTTVVVGATREGSLGEVVTGAAEFVPPDRAGVPPLYGMPGDAPEPVSGIWLQIDFTCPPGSSLLSPLPPPVSPRRSR